MKKSAKFWILTLALAIVLSLVLTLPTLAAETEEGTTEVTTDTPYGDIPDEFANCAMILFDAETKEAFKGVDDWGGDAGALNYMRSEKNGGHSSTILYLQKDVTTAIYYNHGNVSGVHTIDLNGHSLNANSVVFNFNAKSGANNAQFTIKNGKITLNNYNLIGIGSDTNSRGSVANYIFEEIEFLNIKANAHLVTEFDSVSGASTNTTNLTFKDCTFNLSESPAQALCLLGNNKTGRSNQFPVNVTFEGGTINACSASDLDKIFVNGYGTDAPQSYENKTIVFKKGASGYTVGVTAFSATPFKGTIPYTAENGAEYYFIHGSLNVDQTKSIYYLDIYNTEYTTYGFIPQSYIDNPEDHKIVILVDGYGVISANDFGAKKNVANATHGGAFELSRKYAGKDITLLVLEDVSETVTYDNLGYVYGNYTVDLNEKSVTLGSALLSIVAKNSSALDLNFKNGTINVSNKNLVTLSSSSNDNAQNKENTVTFEDLTINVGESSLVLLGNNTKWLSSNQITFKNCTVNSSATTIELFKIRKTTETSKTSDIRFLGGQINYTAVKIPSVYLNESSDSVNISFGDYNGNYPIVTAKDTADVEGIAYPAENEKLYPRKTDSLEDGTVYYKLSAYGFVSTYLNLSSDLNMIYRVFLPAGSDATVTFLIDNFITSVEPIGTDENGLYLFKLKGITPAKMNKEISATLMVNGEAYDSCNGLTIKKYLDKVKEGYSANEKMMALADSLLVYGAAAQQYVDGNTEGFDKDTETALGNLTGIDSSEDVNTNSQTALKYFALSLDGAFTLRAGIELNDVTGVTLEVTKNGKTTTYTVADYPAQGGIIAVPAANIYATELGTGITMVLKRGEEVIDTLTVDANAYLYRASISTNENLATLAKAIYAYGVAADDYVAKDINKALPYLVYSSAK